MVPDATPQAASGASLGADDHAGALRPHVRKFRQIVLWPVQLMPRHEGAQIQRHWEALSPLDRTSVWKEVADEFTGDPTQFGERHYKEFVTFLPYVQRFLYGEGGMHAQLRLTPAHKLRAFASIWVRRRADANSGIPPSPRAGHPA